MQETTPNDNQLPPMHDGSPSARDMEIYEEVSRGKSQTAVAGEFNLTQGRVCQICDAVDQYLFPIHMRRIRLLKSRQTASLNHIYSEAMEAWERSKEKEVVVTETEKETTAGQFPGDTSTSSRTTKQPTGQVAYLTAAMSALKDQRVIWGVEKLEPVEPEKPATEEFRWAGMPREEAKRRWLQHKIALMQAELNGSAETN